MAKLDANGTHVWSQHLGPGGEPRSMEADAAGNVVLVYPGRVLKLGPDGSLIFDIVPDFAVLDVAVDAAGIIYLAGVDTFDARIVKYDANGSVLFSKTFGGPFAQSAQQIAVDVAGAIYIAGSFDRQIDFGDGTVVTVPAADTTVDLFLAKLDATGTTVWAKGFYSPNTVLPTWAETVFDLAADITGGVALLAVNGDGNFGGGALTPPSGYAGRAHLSGFTPGGVHVYTQGLFSEVDNYLIVERVDINDAGDAYVSGHASGASIVGGATIGSMSAFVVKYGATGGFEWLTPLTSSVAETWTHTAVTLDAAGYPCSAASHRRSAAR